MSRSSSGKRALLLLLCAVCPLTCNVCNESAYGTGVILLFDVFLLCPPGGDSKSRDPFGVFELFRLVVLVCDSTCMSCGRLASSCLYASAGEGRRRRA